MAADARPPQSPHASATAPTDDHLSAPGTAAAWRAVAGPARSSTSALLDSSMRGCNALARSSSRATSPTASAISASRAVPGTVRTLHCARLNCWGTFGGLALELPNTTEQVADPGCQGPQTDDSAILASMGSIGGAGGGQKACVGGVKLRIGRSQIGPALNPSRIDPRPSLRQILRELPLQSLGIARHRTIDPARHVADALWLFIRCSEPVA